MSCASNLWGTAAIASRALRRGFWPIAFAKEVPPQQGFIHRWFSMGKAVVSGASARLTSGVKINLNSEGIVLMSGCCGFWPDKRK